MNVSWGVQGYKEEGETVKMKKCAPVRNARFCELLSAITWDGKRVTGKIDRLCELDDGFWAVIDYKSEAASGPEGYAALAEEYRKSLEIYSEAGRQLVAGKKVAGFLWFVETPGNLCR